MIERYKQGSLTWFDVLNPTQNEIHELIGETGIPLTFAHDLTTTTPRTEVQTDKKAIKITLDFPIVKRTDINHPHEVKFIATKQHLITIRFEDIEAIHRFAKEFEMLSLFKAKKKSVSGGFLLVALLARLYQALDIKLDYLESRLADVEEGVFAEREKEMVVEISKVSKRLISFKQTLRPHAAALKALADGATNTFSNELTTHIHDIETQLAHVEVRTAALSTTLAELRETNNSLLTTKQNEVMKTFTILAFITFPLTLFTSMFGMNTVTTPILGQEGDFWIILSIMAVVSISFFAYFRYKKWM